MKRDMDLVRKILFVMEDDNWYLSFSEGHLPQVDGHSEEQIQYHMQIMVQADLLHSESYEIEAGGPGQTLRMKSYSLSWNGHEFLAVARNDTFWNKAKLEMGKALGGTGRFILPVLTELLSSYLRAELRLP